MAGDTDVLDYGDGQYGQGWTRSMPDGTDRNFYIPIGVAIDKNPASPNFGKVFVSNARPARR